MKLGGNNDIREALNESRAEDTLLFVRRLAGILGKSQLETLAQFAKRDPSFGSSLEQVADEFAEDDMASTLIQLFPMENEEFQAYFVLTLLAGHGVIASILTGNDGNKALDSIARLKEGWTGKPVSVADFGVDPAKVSAMSESDRMQLIQQIMDGMITDGISTGIDGEPDLDDMLIGIAIDLIAWGASYFVFGKAMKGLSILRRSKFGARFFKASGKGGSSKSISQHFAKLREVVRSKAPKLLR